MQGREMATSDLTNFRWFDHRSFEAASFNVELFQFLV